MFYRFLYLSALGHEIIHMNGYRAELPELVELKSDFDWSCLLGPSDPLAFWKYKKTHCTHGCVANNQACNFVCSQSKHCIPFAHNRTSQEQIILCGWVHLQLYCFFN